MEVSTRQRKFATKAGALATGVHNGYCDTEDELVIPWTCPACKSCWMFVAGNRDKHGRPRRIGSCPYGGPFNGLKVDGPPAPHP